MLKQLIVRDFTKSQQYVINIVTTILNFAVTALVGFVMSPYIVKNIGVEANGFVSLAYNFTSYAALATAALNSMASRFLMVAYYNNEHKKVGQIYSSVTYANLILAFILTLISLGVITYLEHLIDVPNDILLGVKVLFATIFANFILGTATTSWACAPYITNKLYLTSIANVLNTILKAIFTLALFVCFVPSVSYVGVAALLATVILVFYNYYCKSYLLKISARISNFSFSSIKEIISSGIWNSLSSLGNMLIHGLDLLLAVVFLDATSMGILAVAKTMPLMISSLNEMIANVFTPSFIIDYAKKNTLGIVHTIKQSSKIISVICTVPLGFLFVYGQEFYRLWQPTLNIQLVFILSCITIFGRVFFTGMQPLFNIFTVVNKVKQNSIITVLNGFISCLLTLICLYLFPEWGLYAIAGVSVVCCGVKNLVFVIPYSAKYLGVAKKDFFVTIIPSILCSVILLIEGYIVKKMIPCNSWIWLFISGVIYACIGFMLSSIIALDKNERKILISKVWRRGKKR